MGRVRSLRRCASSKCDVLTRNDKFCGRECYFDCLRDVSIVRESLLELRQCNECKVNFTSTYLDDFCSGSCRTRASNRTRGRTIRQATRSCVECGAPAIDGFCAWDCYYARDARGRGTTVPQSRKFYAEMWGTYEWSQVLRSYRYGLTYTELSEYLRLSDGKCPLCLKRDATSIDHDHGTGAVRGVLCSQCNSALGMFKDDVATMTRAIAYLRESKDL